MTININFPMLKYGEITSTAVEDPTTPHTTMKRIEPDGASEPTLQPHLKGDLSSTKVKKEANRGKKIIGT